MTEVEQPYKITCGDPAHETRRGRPGWAAVLGTSSIPDRGGYLCAACAPHNFEAQQRKRENHDAAVAKFKAFLADAALLSEEERRHVFERLGI